MLPDLSKGLRVLKQILPNIGFKSQAQVNSTRCGVIRFWGDARGRVAPSSLEASPHEQNRRKLRT